MVKIPYPLSILNLDRQPKIAWTAKNKNKKPKKKKHFRVNLNFLYNILSVFMWSINYVWLNPTDIRKIFAQQTNTFFLLNASTEQTIFANKSFNELGKVLSNDVQFVGFLCNTVAYLMMIYCVDQIFRWVISSKIWWNYDISQVFWTYPSIKWIKIWILSGLSTHLPINPISKIPTKNHSKACHII